MYTAKQLIDKFELTKDEKNKFVHLYEPIFEFGMPGRYNNISDVNKAGDSNRENQTSSCFEQACDEFVQRFQSIVCPVNMDWIQFEAGYMYEAAEKDIDIVNKNLDKIADVCNVFKATSNFDSSFTEVCYDLIAGTACLLEKEGDIDNPAIFSAVPFIELSMERGTSGDIISYYRKVKVKNNLVLEQWKGSDFSYEEAEADEETEFLEATYYDFKEKLWIYNVINQEKESIIFDRKSITSPFNDLRWSTCSGETYGRGPGLKVIADVKTLNLIKEYSLRGLAFTIPVFTTTTDDGYNPEKFVFKPGAINPVPSNATNNPTVKQLTVAVNPDITQFNITQLEMDIKRGMFASTIPNDPTKRTTATEIAQRVNELDNSLNNSFGRLQEFLYRLIRRHIEILQKFGHIDRSLDVRAFNGMGYKIKINTQLANQQNRQEITDMLQSLQIFAQFDPTFAFASKVIDLDGLLPYLSKKMGIPVKFIRTKEEIEALKQQEAEAVEAQQDNLISKDIEAANAKEKGKVDAQQ